jgi:hypothetical protein
MAVLPGLAPAHKNRFLGSSSVVTTIQYNPGSTHYTTFGTANDVLRLTARPGKISCDGSELQETTDANLEGFIWKSLPTGGILYIKHTGKEIDIAF